MNFRMIYIKLINNMPKKSRDILMYLCISKTHILLIVCINLIMSWPTYIRTFV